jgi:hypothetical protein
MPAKHKQDQNGGRWVRKFDFGKKLTGQNIYIDYIPTLTKVRFIKNILQVLVVKTCNCQINCFIFAKRG